MKHVFDVYMYVYDSRVWFMSVVWNKCWKLDLKMEGDGRVGLNLPLHVKPDLLGSMEKLTDMTLYNTSIYPGLYLTHRSQLMCVQ